MTSCAGAGFGGFGFSPKHGHYKVFSFYGHRALAVNKEHPRDVMVGIRQGTVQSTEGSGKSGGEVSSQTVEQEDVRQSLLWLYVKSET